jgi:glycopeptide antibiotics resistance protein
MRLKKIRIILYIVLLLNMILLYLVLATNLEIKTKYLHSCLYIILLINILTIIITQIFINWKNKNIKKNNGKMIFSVFFNMILVMIFILGILCIRFME